MTPSISHNTNPFSNRDLIELASLDALGLLDEQERQAYESAFAAAPGSIQQLVRAQQLRVSDIDALLPDVQPRPTLRQRVLAAVGAAMKADTAPSVVGRITPHIAKSRGVASYWRAAAIGCMAAAVLFAVVTVQLSSDINKLAAAIRTDEVSKAFAKEFGPRFENALMNQRTQFLQFASANPAGGSASGMAVLLLDPDSKTGQFFCKGLPNDIGAYTLSVVDSTGKVQTAVMSFNRSDTIVYQNLKLPATPEAGSSFVIQSADQAKTVMQSRSL